MTKPEPTITMTPAELAAFVDARIAERALAGRSADFDPYPAIVPFQRPPRDPVFEAALLRIFDASGGNLGAAVDHFYAEVSGYFSAPGRNITTTPTPGLADLYQVWRRHPITHELLYELDERFQVGSYMENLDRARTAPTIDEQVEQRARMSAGLSLEEELRIAERRVAELREAVR